MSVLDRIGIHRRLSTRLAARYSLLFALTMLAVAAVAQVMIRQHARSSVRAAMTTSGEVYDRLWALKAGALADSAGVLARDFGFRAAVASGDAPTIVSSLDNLAARASAAHALVVESDGRVIGTAPRALRRLIGAAVPAWPTDRRDAVVATRAGFWRIVVSPIMAPMQIGSVVLATPLDARQMQALQGLSAIPLTATLLARDGRGGWIDPATRLHIPDGATTREPVALDVGGARTFALVKPLRGPGDTP